MRTMVQGPGPDRGAPPLRFRDRHRLARHREFLDAAREILTSEGGAALTMQRVTEAVGSSTGGIYVYFASKDALLAELQREAMVTLRASLVTGLAQLDAWLEEQGVERSEAAVARVVASGHFWVAAEESYPSELNLIRGFLAPQVGQDLSSNDGAGDVLAAAYEMLQEVARHCIAASEQGVLQEGEDLGRALVLVSSVMVVLLVSSLSRWDQALFDGHRLAAELVRDLVRGWGAAPEMLAAAEAQVTRFAAGTSLAPPVDRR